MDKPRQEIIDLAVRELAEFFPVVREATLTKATVVKEVHATFSPAPGSDAFRPPHTSPWPRLLLAGDWTATIGQQPWKARCAADMGLPRS